MDKKGNGEVTSEEFHEFFKLTETPFSQRGKYELSETVIFSRTNNFEPKNCVVFSAVDLDGSGELDFQEILLGLWNLNTKNYEALIKFCYDIFYIDRGGSLYMAELMHLCVC